MFGLPQGTKTSRGVSTFSEVIARASKNYNISISMFVTVTKLKRWNAMKYVKEVKKYSQS